MNPPMKSSRIANGFVYVIAASNGYVKIGSTGGDPYERFGMVACHSPLPVSIAYICRCPHPVDVEEAVHRALVAKRAHREWFDVHAEQAIDAIHAVLAARGYLVAKVEGRKQSSVGARIVRTADLTEMAMPAG